MGKLVRGKQQPPQDLTLANTQQASQQANEQLQSPFEAVDDLHGQVVGSMLNRVDVMAQDAAAVAQNLPTEYLKRFAGHLGAAGVASVDGFLADLAVSCQVPRVVRAEAGAGVQSTGPAISAIDG